MRTLLVDLDGTLVDPGPGIIRGVRAALASLGRPLPDPAELRWVIGPPLRSSLRTLLGPDGDVETAIRVYRDDYSRFGLTMATVYPGIRDALARLRAAGTPLVLCTAKPTVFARRVLEHTGLHDLFEAVHGAELDGRFEDKAELISAIRQTRPLDPATSWMIGDREHDVTAAKRNGIRSIGVLWGYGGEAELRAAGADRLCAAAADLIGAVDA